MSAQQPKTRLITAYDEAEMTQNDPTRGARRGAMGGAMSRALTNQIPRPVLHVALLNTSPLCNDPHTGPVLARYGPKPPRTTQNYPKLSKNSPKLLPKLPKTAHSRNQ